MEEPKRNQVHIVKLKNYRTQLTKMIKGLNEDVDWVAFHGLVSEFIKEISGSYNNREMAIVLTKLQESGCWIEEKNVEQVSSHLKEARYWAGEYLKTLE